MSRIVGQQNSRAVRCVTALALDLGVATECVESRAQWEIATALGCKHTQGFWLGYLHDAHLSH